MNKNRLFSFVVIVALAAMTALTISQVVATNHLVSAASAGRIASSNQVGHSSNPDLCSTLDVNHASIHMVYVEQLGRWMPFTDNGPTGVDGGLMQLLSDRRTCSQ